MKSKNNSQPLSVMVGANKPNRPHLLPIIGVLLAVGAIGLGIFLTQDRDKQEPETPRPTVQAELPKPEPITYEDTVTPTAFGKFLAISLETYWAGGNANGTEIKGHKYYPSVADIKNSDWAIKNLKLNKEITSSIKNGAITYEPQGCDADKPSSEQNKCTSFSVLVDGQEAATSNN